MIPEHKTQEEAVVERDACALSHEEGFVRGATAIRMLYSIKYLTTTTRMP